ncbi:MAG: hypothetical protein Q8J96_07680 [Rhodocyclaceae bacterium]|nr:hypothetical protein [Rhodocyclaceae bacterium]MDP3033195.1 hypothetical protein [Rhodocyclaceae bacterium]
MSTIPLPLYVAFFFFLGGALLLNLHHRYQNKQRALPARDQYLAAHHLAEPICHVCGSGRLAERGLTHGEDERRIFSCLDCKEMLFQERRAADVDEDSA